MIDNDERCAGCSAVPEPQGRKRRVSWVVCALLAACGDAPREEGADRAGWFGGEVAATFRMAGDWPRYHGDPAGTRYSPLGQIHVGNVANLTRAWSYDLGPAAGDWQVTPLVVDGTMYLTAPNRVVALDADAGSVVWRHRSRETPSRRGLAYWPGGRGEDPRVYFTAGRHLVAISARTGRRVSSFGAHGEVEIGGQAGSDAVPVVFGDVVVVPTPDDGRVTAFDAGTGQKRWAFQPMIEQLAADADRAALLGGRLPAGFTVTADVDRGLLFVTFGGAPAAGRSDLSAFASPFANAVAALDMYTGALRWRFQAVQGDPWRYAPSAPPALLDAHIDGRELALLAWATPTGHLYVLDRMTGEPLHDVEERSLPMPAAAGRSRSEAEPGGDEEARRPDRPFQRVPLMPPPLSRVGFEPADLIAAGDTNETHAAYCAEFRLDPERDGAAGDARTDASSDTLGDVEAPMTPLFPGRSGGAGWGGVAAHPALAHVFVNTTDLASWMPAVAGRPFWELGGAAAADMRFEAEAEPRTEAEPEAEAPSAPFWQPFVSRGGRPGDDVTAAQGSGKWPCQKPPWGRLLAVDALAGEILWEVPLGVTDALEPDKRRTGRPNTGGPIVTAGGLVFVGAADDGRFRAFHAATGAQLWSARLAANAHAVPVSYHGRDGKQYVAVAAAAEAHRNARSEGLSLVVFSLP